MVDISNEKDKIVIKDLGCYKQARVCLKMGDLVTANTYIEKAGVCFRRFRKVFPQTDAVAYYHLLKGDWFKGMGQYSDAVDDFCEAKQIWEGISPPNHSMITEINKRIAVCHFKSLHFLEAVDCLLNA